MPFVLVISALVLQYHQALANGVASDGFNLYKDLTRTKPDENYAVFDYPVNPNMFVYRSPSWLFVPDNDQPFNKRGVNHFKSLMMSPQREEDIAQDMDVQKQVEGTYHFPRVLTKRAALVDPLDRVGKPCGWPDNAARLMAKKSDHSYLQEGRLQQEIQRVQEKLKREHGKVSDNNQSSNDDSSQASKPKKRRSRWAAPEADKTFIPGMPTILPTNLTKEQEEAYLLQLQIEEVSRKLRSGDLGIPANPEERSPSPEPIYSHDGKRLNTREYRTRKNLEEERHSLIMKMQSIYPDFKPPADYKPPLIRVSDKVMIPQDEHPDINFVGLLIGPRGNTLKTMEKDTGAKIIIRGKGSVKEGKVGRKDGQPLPGEDEPLHAYVTASNPEAVKKAVDKIKDVIRQGVEVPEGQNDLRRNQLRELALLNGTLRELDGPRCSNCGAADHKQWMCPDKPNVTKTIICASCGGSGHIAKDCRNRRPGSTDPATAGAERKIDQEYMSLMAELGEGPPVDKDLNRGRTSRFNDDRSADRFRGGSNLFDGRGGPIKALMAPENTVPPPPGQAPWTNSTGASGVPPAGVPPPMAMPMWNAAAALTVPPPPPPSSIPPLLPWLNNSSTRQPPPPGATSVPPPPSPDSSTAVPPWKQSQVQPPPPPSGQQPQSMYPPWQAPMMMGYPGIISAPPPPPPS